MIFSSVVLPHPLGPRTTRVRPSGTLRLRFWMENVEPRPPGSLSVLLTSTRSMRATLGPPLLTWAYDSATIGARQENRSKEIAMKIGVVLPQTEIGNDPAAIKAYGEAVEGMGFTHVLVFDHVLGANPERPGGWKGPYTYRHAFHEPFVLFGFLAAATRRVGLVTGIIILPQRQTALVAKQAAAVDVLSGGRLRLGVGVGWNAVEFEALGERFTNRGARIEEQIAVLRALWARDLVTIEGQWHRVTDAGLNPLPPRSTIPIWMGGESEPVVRRAARLADGWMPHFRPGPEAQAIVDRLHGL